MCGAGGRRGWCRVTSFQCRMWLPSLANSCEGLGAGEHTLHLQDGFRVGSEIRRRRRAYLVTRRLLLMYSMITDSSATPLVVMEWNAYLAKGFAGFRSVRFLGVPHRAFGK